MLWLKAFIAMYLHFFLASYPHCASPHTYPVSVLPAGEHREGRSDRILTVAATRRALSSERWDLAATWLGESDTLELRWGMCRTRMNISNSMAANTRDFPGTRPPLSPPSPKARGFSFSSSSSSSEKGKKCLSRQLRCHSKNYMTQSSQRS